MSCEGQLSYNICMFRLSLILSLSMVLIACGAQKVERAELTFTETSEGTPKTYRFIEKSCDKLSAENLPTNPEIKLFNAGKYHTVEMESVSSNLIVNQLLLGGEVEEGRLRNGGLKELQPAKKFQYCFQPDELKEDHFEDAALSILDPIIKFEKRYKDLVTKNQIQPVNIRVLPRYHRLKPKAGRAANVIERRQLINNAFYSGSRKEIVFLPQGATKIGFIPFGGVPLWKHPMVPMHEYGHHVFRELTETQNKLALHTTPDSFCIDNRDTTFGYTYEHRGHYFVSDHKRKVNTKVAINALNEGFADIFSYYGNEKKNDLKRFGCMFMSRDVNSFFFMSAVNRKEIGDEHKKILTQEALDSFLNESKKETKACNVETNFQNIHTIGAIYAHAFDKMLKQTKASKLEKLNILLSWLRKMKPIFKKSPAIPQLFEAASHHFYQIFESKFPEKKSLCNFYYTSFPTFKNTCQ